MKDDPLPFEQTINFQMDPRDILINVLSIIDYQDDKDAYADEFIDLCEKQALLDALQLLPSEQQKAFQLQISRARRSEKVKALIQQFITPEEYTRALTLAAGTAFQAFIETLLPELSEDQKSNLEKYLDTLMSLESPNREQFLSLLRPRIQ